MKLIHYIILAAVAVLTSCGDFNENLDGFDKNTYKPTDVKKVEVELTDADYEKIASLMKDDDLKTKKYFISGSYAAQCISVWLKQKYPTADNGSSVTVTYRMLTQFAMKTTDTGNQSEKNEPKNVTNPFEKIAGEWKYNPSVVLTLPNEKGNATSKSFYNRIIIWVNIKYDEPNGFGQFNPGGYLNGFADTEYFSGCSYYKNRVEWVAADAKSNTPSVYGGMTDEEVIATMQRNLITTFAVSLSEGFENAEPVEGMDVTYTVNFVAHMEGKKLVPYTIQYLVTGKGEFTYVEGSLKPVN